MQRKPTTYVVLTTPTITKFHFFFTSRKKRTLRTCLKAGLLHVCDVDKRGENPGSKKALYTIAYNFELNSLVETVDTVLIYDYINPRV